MAGPHDRFHALRNLRRAVVLSSLLVALFGLAFSWLTWEAERERQSAYFTSLVEMGERSLNSYFGDIERALSILGEDILGKGRNIDLRNASVLLKRFRRVYPELRITIVARLDGQILVTSESAPGASLPTLGAEPSFQRSREELQAGARLSIGRPFLGPVSGEWIIPVRYGIRGDDGSLRYLLGAGLPVSRPQAFWIAAPLPPGAAMGLSRDDMYVVSRYPLPDAADPKNLYGTAQSGSLARHLADAKFPNSGSVEGVSTVTHEYSLWQYRRLADYPLTLYINNPRSNIWAAWWRDVRVPYLLMLVWLLGSLAIYAWVRRRQRSFEEERETHLRVATEAARVGLWARDLDTGEVQWSPEFKRLLGYAPDELQESHDDWISRTHPDDRAAALERVAAVTRARVGRYEGEIRLRHRDGDYRTFLLLSAVPETESGRSNQLVGAVVDITERKRNEEEVRRLNARLEQRVAERSRELARANDELIRTEKLAALGRMVAGVAHELNTPIGNSLLAATTLGEHARVFAKEVAEGPLRRTALDRFLGETREAGDILQRNLHSAADLISGFKRLSTDQLSGQRRRFPLKEVVDEVLMAMRPTLKRAPFTVSASVEEIEMDSYPGPLSQVLINLVQNAAMHAFDGRANGTVSIRAARVNEHRVEISVADNGVGIPPADQKRVFDPFYTTKLGRGGSGLGLTIANNLVIGPLEGKIFLESAPGAGTTVRLVLPLEVR